MAKINCWEFTKCGREPGGVKASELGVCPAFNQVKTDGIHGGKNGGRSCWVIAGTFCGGNVQGSYACKLANCMNCDFYKLVSREEGQARKESKELLTILRS